MTKFCTCVDIRNVITYATFGDDRLRDLDVARGRISDFPIDLRRRPYSTLALPCECVIKFIFCRFRASAYTNVDRLCAVFLYNTVQQSFLQNDFLVYEMLHMLDILKL